MRHDSENFSKNMDLLMSHLKLTQYDLASALEFPKTTVNKWFVSNSIPNKDNLEKICSRIKHLLTERLPDADSSKTSKINEIDVDLLLGNPYVFATAISMPWYKVGAVVNKARLPVKNLVFEPNDNELWNITGFYIIFFPSVAYEGAFFAAALKITLDDDFFYFEQFSKEFNDESRGWKLPRLYQSGSVGRFGKAETSNAILIGDLVGKEGEDVEPFVQFTIFKIPRESRPEKLSGRAMALNFNKESSSYGHLLATPAVALAKPNIPQDWSVKKLVPEKAYFDHDEMEDKYPGVISALEQSPAPWCFVRGDFHKSAKRFETTKIQAVVSRD